MAALSRRAFLLGSGGAVLLAACSSDGGGSTATPETVPSGPVLGEAFDRNNLLLAGVEQRAPFLLFEAEGGLLAYEDSPASLTFTAANAEDGTVLDGLTVERAGGSVRRAYYPLVATFPTPGVWTIETELGGETLGTQVAVNGELPVPQVGDPMPSAPTPTVADPLGVEHLCTEDPACPLHDVSVDAALGAGRSLALLVSTPAYCNTAICGPVLELLVGSDRPEGMDAVHLEVYPGEAPPDGAPSPLVFDTFGLQWEPVLFVADATGTITARLDNIFDDAELAAALASASG